MILREFTNWVSIGELFNAFLSSDSEFQHIIFLSDVSNRLDWGRKQLACGWRGFFSENPELA